MIIASQLRPGMAVRHEGQNFKVVGCEYHPGQGKMGGVTHVRLQNLSTRTFRELSLRAELKLDTLPVEKLSMEFLYADGDQSFFMNPQNYEQIGVDNQTIRSISPIGGNIRPVLRPQAQPHRPQAAAHGAD